MKKLLPLIIGLVFLCKADALRATLYFWDTNGQAPGAGGTAPTGTWGVDAFWSADDSNGNLGVQATVAWLAGKDAVFAAGNDATGAYTVNVSGMIQVGNIHVDLGQVTFAPTHSSGDSLHLMDSDGIGANRLLSVGHKDANALAQYNVPLTTATNVTRYKRGTLILGATNTFTGTFTIEGGGVRCVVPYALGGVNPLVLANNDTTRGDFNSAWQYTPAVFDTGGFNQRLGSLNLAGSDATVQRTIDFGSGASALTFADSSGQRWTSDNGLPIPLHIVNYTPGVDSLRFGTSANGLRKAQLGQIRFADFGDVPGQIDSNGFVTPASLVIQSIRRNGP